ncbi:MAG: hypothetical protein IT462_08640 [Planctomycetes bacterium]|nr:hypothetical protein [Planctomycetota bacterium]
MGDQRQRAQQALIGFVRGLAQRQGTGKTAVSVELTQETCSAGLQAGATGQDEAEISEANFTFAPGGVAFSARVRVRGRAWPPRPPVDTRLSLKIADVVVSSEGASGRVMFRVDEPLSLSSAFAEVVLGLLNFFGGPDQLDALRRKGAVVTLDFAQIVRTARPDLAPMAELLRLHKVALGAGVVRLEIGFNYG